MTIVDITGPSIQADMEVDIVDIKLEGTMAEILTKLDPKLYRKYVITENNKSMLYVRLKRVIYVTIYASLLFW